MTTWSDTEDVIIGGDLAVALGYLTPAGGVVVTPVAPTGLRDRAAGTVSFSTSLGFGRKLERIARNPRVALAFHAREHGFANDPHFVLVQGEATYETEPQPQTVERILAASERYFGPTQTGAFWDQWLRSYYRERVLVTIDVERVTSWQEPSCSGAAICGQIRRARQ
jgi:Pyridoxamine 5'-phosphate oxidase